MQRFNLSAWAITHRTLILFAMIVLAGAGIYSYLNLGRAEDPSFTIKVMIVNVVVAGRHCSRNAKAGRGQDREETAGVAVPRPRRKLLAAGRFLYPYHPQRYDAARQGEGALVPGPQESRRTSATICRPTSKDRISTTSSATSIRRSTCSPATGLTLADLKARAEDIRQRLLRVPDVNKVDIIGERPQKIFIEFSHAKLATLGITPQQIFDSVARQNAVMSGGSVETSADRINLRVTGAFSGVEAIAAVPVQADGQNFRLGDIATVKRGYEDPPSFIVRARRQARARSRRLHAGGRQHHHARRRPEEGHEVDHRRAAGRRGGHAGRRSAARRRRVRSRSSSSRSPKHWSSCWSVSFLSLGCAPVSWSRCRCRWSWRSCSS